MKILITGAGGMLARAVVERFLRSPENELVLTDIFHGGVPKNGETEVGSGQIEGSQVSGKTDERVKWLELDITDEGRVKNVFKEIRPEVVVNCAAYTAVDKAETQEELAYKINAEGPRNLAEVCRELGEETSGEAEGALAQDGISAQNGEWKAPILIHISTDYVFGGKKPVTEEYAEDDPKEPETAYGRTKLAGEEAIASSGCNYYIFRTAWLYGHHGSNFVKTMLGVAKNRDEVQVVDDQWGSPTYAEDLAEVIYRAVTEEIPQGIYNVTDLGFTTWAGFTEKIYELAGVDCKVAPISSEEYEEQARERAGEDYKVAPRPKNSKMSKTKLLEAGIEMPTWEEGLKRYLEREGALARAEKQE